MDKFFFALLAFVPIALIGRYIGLPPVAVFFLSAIAIVPLAKYIGQATEELSAKTGSALGGLLNATFGNAVELIIGVLAIKAGLIEVVRASITGSVIGNLLLVLGTAMFFGGWRHKKQEFNRTAAMASGSSLFLAATALIVPAIFSRTAPGTAAGTIEELSIFVAVLMIVLYGSGLWFALFTHKHLYVEEAKLEPRWSNKKSLLVLFFATLAVSWVSEILVGSIEPLVQTLGWTELFIGVIFVAVIGNVAEHTSAITMAIKNRLDLTLQVAIGSATQIIMFVAPLLVLVSLFFAAQMNIIFNTFELTAIVLSVILVNLVVADGESNWLEGLQLVAAYTVIGVAFFLHP